MIDKRKELEQLADAALEEIRDKGFTEERGREYQRRQTEWWNECDNIKYQRICKYY
jgi:DNA topoisomerase IB|tara:strand:+ start:205 stop:372 length:168 start_codon:yes stop_codon:yes gene_type:complete